MRQHTTNVSYQENATYVSEQTETNVASKINREVELDESPGISKATSDTYSYRITTTFSFEAIYNRYQIQMDQILNKKYR